MDHLKFTFKAKSLLMRLALTVSLLVIAVVLVVGLIGYLINRLNRS